MPLLQIAPYLNFPGTCKDAMTFYAKVFGGEIEAMMTAEGTPIECHMPKDQIIHSCLKIGDYRIMGSDAPPEYFAKSQGMSASLHFDDPAEGKRIFDALAEGGKADMSFAPTFWAKGFGTCTDRFGTPWMINCS